MTKKTIFYLSAFTIFLSLFCLPVLAQETEDNELTDEDVPAADLDVEEPGIVSWFKNAIDDVQILIVRDPIKKSEIQLRKASRQLIKARNLVKKNPDNPELQEKLQKLDEKYQGLIEAINNRIEKYKQGNADAPQVKNFLDKYTDQQIKHQEILQKLEEQVPDKVMEIIRTNRERHLQKFGEVMNRLQNKEELKERLENIIINNVEGVERQVRQMEILDELEQNTTSEAQEVKDGISRLKKENQDFFQNLREKREQIQIRQGIQ